MTSVSSSFTKLDRVLSWHSGPGGLAVGDGQKPRGNKGGERHVSHCGLLSLQILELGLDTMSYSGKGLFMVF